MIRALARLPLTLRVPLVTAALTVVVGLVASQQVLMALTRAQEARLRELVRLHVDGLSVALGPAVLRQDIWEVYDVLDRARRAGEGQRMLLTVVADRGGRVIAATDPRRAAVDTPLADVADLAVVPTLEHIALRAGAMRLRVRAPLIYQSRAVGSILTELDVSDLATARRRAVRLLIAFSTVATGALALLGYLTTRRMLRPVAMLAKRMAGAEGSPEPIPMREVPRGDSELARLFHTYNAMTEAIEARADAERRLAERERLVSLGRLSSSLAHEINNPLGGLLNAADTSQSYPERTETVRRSAALLMRGLGHLRDITKAALEQNRLVRHDVELSREDLEDLRLLLTPEARRLDQTLGWCIDLPEDGSGGYPAGPVRQIALNLALNALHAAGQGGTVSLSAEAGEGGLRLTVVDDGPGLSAAERERLFTSRPAGAPPGGVGLRMVRDLVAGLGGSIADHRRGGRTEIVVTLPRRAERGAA